MGYLWAKRALDVSVASVLLVAALPALAVVGAIIRMDSHGPAIYRGRRIGRNGRPFYIYKFRTMCVDAERDGTTTRINDARVTRVGLFLRKYKLDELPQLLNVLSGDMSLVGPRPEVEEHTAAYSNDERRILDVKPGITDFASIRFIDLTTELGAEDPHTAYVTRIRPEKNRLRLEYVRRRSFSTDLRILGATVVAVLRKATK